MTENTVQVIPIPLTMTQAFLVKGERPILVDAGNPGDARHILKALRAHEVSPDELSLIILTHCHVDHFGGLLELRQSTKAKVAIHKAEAEALRQGNNSELYPAGLLGRILRLFITEQTKLPGIQPDMLIDHQLDLEQFGVAGKVFSTPGHTSGSLSIMLANDEVIIGDLVFGGFLRKHTPKYPWFVTDMEHLHKSLRFLVGMRPKTMYASHGGPFSPQQIILAFGLQ